MNSEEFARRTQLETLDSWDEELELELEDRPFDEHGREIPLTEEDKRERHRYFRNLLDLQAEQVKLLDWVVATGYKQIVLFVRSLYNRAGVERVMGFCSDDQYEEFFRSVPEFERMLVRSGIQVVKYWFSISDEEQHLRFMARIRDPLKQWKLSPMDLESRRRWEDYTKAKETMIERTHIPEAPWWVEAGDDT